MKTFLWTTQGSDFGPILFDQSVETDSQIVIKKGDPRSSLKDIESHLRRGEYLLFGAPYKTAIQFYHSLKIRAEKKKAKSYQAERELKAKVAKHLSYFLIPLEDSFETLLKWHPKIDLTEFLRICSLEEFQTIKALPFKTLMACISAYERYKKGLLVDCFNFLLRPYFGVYYPIRQEPIVLLKEYFDKQKDLKDKETLDLGSGSGVLSFLASTYGQKVLGVDLNPVAVESAKNNFLIKQFPKLTFEVSHFFPEGKFDFVICNPPWVPGKVASPLDSAIFYEESFFEIFFGNLKGHLKEGGKCLLITSDFAEILGLQKKDYLRDIAKKYGFTMEVEGRAAPTHPRSRDKKENSYAARSSETVFLLSFII